METSSAERSPDSTSKRVGNSWTFGSLVLEISAFFLGWQNLVDQTPEDFFVGEVQSFFILAKNLAKKFSFPRKWEGRHFRRRLRMPRTLATPLGGPIAETVNSFSDSSFTITGSMATAWIATEVQEIIRSGLKSRIPAHCSDHKAVIRNAYFFEKVHVEEKLSRRSFEAIFLDAFFGNISWTAHR